MRGRVRERTLALEWTTGRDIETWAQWSPDEGQTWLGLATGLRGGRAEVDTSVLPTGKVLVRLLAHDGFFTVTSDHISLEVPARGATVAIFHPWPRNIVDVGTTLRLWGTATDSAGQEVGSGYARWLIDGDEVARGLDVFIRAPEAGKHRCTLLVEVAGERAEASVEFETVDVPYDSP